MKIIIIPYSYGNNFPNSASERIRCDWLLPYLPADKYDGSQNLNDYDVIIYQKGYRPGLAKFYKGKALQVLDLTDPIWYSCPVDRLRKMYDYIDIFVFSTEELRRNFEIFFPDMKDRTEVIEDRIELNMFPEKKIHSDKEPVFVWFGYADNFIRCSELLPFVEGYELITICERSLGIGKFVQWKIETVNSEIIKGDIVLNPLCNQYLKTSLNKHLVAWALNMPIAETIDDIERLMDYKNRVIESRFDGKNYRIENSAYEILDIVERYK